MYTMSITNTTQMVRWDTKMTLPVSVCLGRRTEISSKQLYPTLQASRWATTCWYMYVYEQYWEGWSHTRNTSTVSTWHAVYAWPHVYMHACYTWNMYNFKLVTLLVLGPRLHGNVFTRKRKLLFADAPFIYIKTVKTQVLKFSLWQHSWKWKHLNTITRKR